MLMEQQSFEISKKKNPKQYYLLLSEITFSFNVDAPLQPSF